MAKTFTVRVDQFSRRHPKLMFAVVVLAALATTLILVLFPQGQLILYRVF
jgi:hypothetical protein